MPWSSKTHTILPTLHATEITRCHKLHGGQLHGELPKPQNSENRRVGAYTGMSACFAWDNTVVDIVSHFVLQVTGKEKLYHISITTATGHHKGSTAILWNGMRQNSRYHVINMEKDNNGEVHTCFKV